MNKLIGMVAVFVTSYLIKAVLFGAAEEATGGRVNAVSPQPTGVRAEMTLYLAQALGLGTLSQDDLALLTSIAAIYCFVVGFFGDLILEEHGLGKALNGFVAFIGAFVALFLYATIFGQFHEEHFSVMLIVVVAASTGTMLLAALLKHYAIDKAEDVIRAPSTRPTSKATAADRFNRIANR